MAVVAAAALFVENLFYTAVLPLLPELAQRHSLSKTGTGVLVGAYAAGQILGSFPAISLSRRIEFKGLLVVGLGLLALSTAAFALASSIVLLDVSRLVQGIGGGFTWIGTLGWVSGMATRRARGALIGRVMSVGVIGGVVGPVIGGLAAAWKLSLVFGLLAVLQGVMALVVVRTPGEAPRLGLAEGRVSILHVRPAVLWGVSLVALPALLVGVYEVLTPLRLDHAGASTALITAVFVGGGLAEAVMAPFAGRFSDRAGRLAPLRISLVLAPLLCLLLSASLRLAVLVPVAIAAWLALAASFVPAMALTGDLAQEDEHQASSAWGLLNLVLAGGILLGSTVGAAAAEAWGDPVPYAVVGAACILLLYRIGHMDSSPIADLTTKTLE